MEEAAPFRLLLLRGGLPACKAFAAECSSVVEQVLLPIPGQPLHIGTGAGTFYGEMTIELSNSSSGSGGGLSMGASAARIGGMTATAIDAVVTAVKAAGAAKGGGPAPAVSASGIPVGTAEMPSALLDSAPLLLEPALSALSLGPGNAEEQQKRAAEEKEANPLRHLLGQLEKQPVKQPALLRSAPLLLSELRRRLLKAGIKTDVVEGGLVTSEGVIVYRKRVMQQLMRQQRVKQKEEQRRKALDAKGGAAAAAASAHPAERKAREEADAVADGGAGGEEDEEGEEEDQAEDVLSLEGPLCKQYYAVRTILYDMHTIL